jgi:hypothetical protein
MVSDIHFLSMARLRRQTIHFNKSASFGFLERPSAKDLPAIIEATLDDILQCPGLPLVGYG